VAINSILNDLNEIEAAFAGSKKLGVSIAEGNPKAWDMWRAFNFIRLKS